jgi:hypothetical protein
MISVSDHQLRIVAEAAEGLPAEARGTFLRRVVAEVRQGRSFKDSDIERAVRMALLGQSMKQASVSSTDQGRRKQRSDTPIVSEATLASRPFAAFLRRIAGLLLVRLKAFPRSFDFINCVNIRCGRSCGMLRGHFELAERRVLEGEEHIARQREIVARLEDLREPVTLQTARDLLRNMEHAQMLHITERDRVREFLGESS